ncbi:unnamed protein product [Prunus armeniaca]|uniref:Uncharacterized protein n=1 Tax=Prunus armeniaca TaxID=36596 RepID=A0A6J5UV60_PRUAR|nr:unnamed protein product [Prunus armeniaca]
MKMLSGTDLRDLSTQLGPRPTAPPVIKSRSGTGGEDAKKPENGNGRENGVVAKPSLEGANGGGGGGHNGKHSGGGNGSNGKHSEGGTGGKPDGGVAGDEGGNGAVATEGAGEGGILEKLLEKLHDIFG